MKVGDTMRVILINVLLFFSSIATLAQPLVLDMDIFAERRRVFTEHMSSGSVAIFPSKPVYQRNLDVDYDYRQESNFYYLSGFQEPESIVLLNPTHPRYKFVLFVRKRDARRETYDGPRAGIDGAMKDFRADTAFTYDDFSSAIPSLLQYDRTIYYTFGINPEIDEHLRTLFVERRSRGNYPIVDPSAILAEMRLIKNDGDWRMGLKQAIDISAKAHIEAMKSIAPGMYEYEVQAKFEFVYRAHGSPRNGYPCIVGSGPNSGILHYDVNTRQLQDGEVLLMDCAAEYGFYSADITRTVPVNGRFTNEQREIYQLVLDAQTAGMSVIKPGVLKSAIDDTIDAVLGNGLVRLGFIKDKAHFRIFSLHGYAHWLGLEVHDVGAYTINGTSRPLRSGMVFTVEPGIYVRPDVFDKMRDLGYTEEEIRNIRPVVERYIHIGVRIEDDVTVTPTGYVNLSAGVPREINDVEALMRQRER
jgi:Xaa-Pro aminopeptidase